MGCNSDKNKFDSVSKINAKFEKKKIDLARP